MANMDYHFVTNWQVKGRVEEVYDIIGDPVDLPRWWPAVYLEVEELEPGDDDGVGKIVRLYTKGWLPYTLRWQFHVSQTEKPNGFTLDAVGDFVGRGVWKFEQCGSLVNVHFDWKIHAEKPILKSLTWLLRPVFSANHRWAMKKGEESLKIELLRRRFPEGTKVIPQPPGPTFPHNLIHRRPRAGAS
ncbi:SRPBCC family protein [bacterium]|nr:SRPBCC family protein [bacterium]